MSGYAVDISEMRARLESQCEAVVRHLLPNGAKVGTEWAVGDIHGAAPRKRGGGSLKVELSASGKRGLWSDFATGESGDIIDLWRLSKGLTIAETIKEVKAYLGIQDAPVGRPSGRRREYRKPELKPYAVKAEGAPLAYLVDERGLSPETVDAYRVGSRGRQIILPFFTPAGEPALVKYRSIDRDENGKARTAPLHGGMAPILFGWQAIPEDAREVVITEGEIDAMSWGEIGIPALSVPFGGGGGNKQQWIDLEWDNLDRFETIYLSMDADDAGEEALEALVDRLGKERCRIIRLPAKDANEALTDEGLGPEIMRMAYDEAESFTPEELISARDVERDVVNRFFGEVPDPGYRMALPSLGELVFRPGDMTVWQGATGAGKSQVLGHSLLQCMQDGGRVLIASLEMRPSRVVERMVRQASGTGTPTQQIVSNCFSFFDDRLWLFNVVGKSGINELIPVFEYARRRCGVDVFVVDSLMRIDGVGPEDFTAQENAVFELVGFAVQKNVHVHLVAHSRKRDTNEMLGNEDIKGTSEIGSQAANIVGVMRDKQLEQMQWLAAEEIRSGIRDEDEEYHQLISRPTVTIACTKQRNGDWEGSVKAFFDVSSYQYREHHRDRPHAIPQVSPHHLKQEITMPYDDVLTATS